MSNAEVQSCCYRYLTPSGRCETSCALPLLPVGDAAVGRACISAPGGDVSTMYCSSTGSRMCACPTSTAGEGCLQCAFQNETVDSVVSTVVRCTTLPAAAFTSAELGAANVPGKCSCEAMAWADEMNMERNGVEGKVCDVEGRMR